MVDHINQLESKHIITIEDPVEFVHRSKKSLINQREVGADTLDVRARVAEGAERERIWDKQKATQPGFAAYETQSPRTIHAQALRG